MSAAPTARFRSRCVEASSAVVIVIPGSTLRGPAA